jgi:hypothetical protein
MSNSFSCSSAHKEVANSSPTRAMRIAAFSGPLNVDTVLFFVSSLIGYLSAVSFQN